MDKLNKKRVLIDRGGFLNKGAELMLNAVVEKLRESGKPYVPVIGHINGKLSAENQQLLGLKKTFMPKKNYKMKTKVRVYNSIPDRILGLYNRVSLRNIDIVLDIGGFRFGDQWNKLYARQKSSRMNKYYSRLKKQGAKIVFLPQAFGPFETDAARKWFLCAARHATLIYCREPVSYDHVQSILGKDPRVKLSPDFTNLCSGNTSEESLRFKGKVCIIPNVKMVSHSKESGRYLDFLVELIETLQKIGRNAFLLNHEGPLDYELCKQISNRLSGTIPVLNGQNAKDIKGVIGASYAVISSRYHGVVSALSQGVPCLCTSWSHKYPLLLEEYECKDALLLSNEHSAALTALRKYMDPKSNEKIRQHLSICSSRMKTIVNTMWEEVLALI